MARQTRTLQIYQVAIGFRVLLRTALSNYEQPIVENENRSSSHSVHISQANANTEREGTFNLERFCCLSRSVVYFSVYFHVDLV